jgi:hypothetical protein
MVAQMGLVDGRWVERSRGFLLERDWGGDTDPRALE